MTWLRFTRLLEAIPQIQRIESGRGLDHAELIEIQKKQQASQL